MAFLVAHAEKFSIGACAGLGIHVDRKSEEHSNKNIDKSFLKANERLRKVNKKRDTGISLFLLFFTNHLLVI